jgi:putative addiction module component (TIGR02574 family)
VTASGPRQRAVVFCAHAIGYDAAVTREVTMSQTATVESLLDAAKTLSVDDRRRLVEGIGDTILEETLPSLTDDQKAELDRRIIHLDTNPDDVLTWEEVKAYVRRDRS